MKRWPPILLSLVIAACGSPPELGERQKVELAAQAAILLERTQVSGQVEKESWGKSIRALNPRVVYITNDGIYIQTGRGFVTEQGLFFPRVGTAMNGTTGTDPLYRALGNGIYWYEIKG